MVMKELGPRVISPPSHAPWPATMNCTRNLHGVAHTSPCALSEPVSYHFVLLGMVSQEHHLPHKSYPRVLFSTTFITFQCRASTISLSPSSVKPLSTCHREPSVLVHCRRHTQTTTLRPFTLLHHTHTTCAHTLHSAICSHRARPGSLAFSRLKMLQSRTSRSSPP